MSSQISIHALLAESDSLSIFKQAPAFYFYPRSPCGERQMHALKLANTMLFLSTLSLRRATDVKYKRDQTILFLSTLSLRRATAGKGPAVKGWRNFYPRSPCGERPVQLALKMMMNAISIHALLAESDARSLLNSPNSQISIHALLAESDLNAHLYYHSRGLFLSTLSLRRATLRNCIY